MAGIGLALGGMAQAFAQAASTPIPVEHFFANSAFSGAKLSPGGRYLAVRMSKPGSRIFLTVIDLETKSAKTLAEYTDADIDEVRWISDKRIVFDTMDLSTLPGDQYLGPGLFAVDQDGGNFIQLKARSWRGTTPQLRGAYLLHQTGAQDSAWIYVGRSRRNSFGDDYGRRLLRLDTLTGVAEDVPMPDGKVDTFVLDAKGEPRLALGYGDEVTALHYRDPGTGKWRQVAQYDRYRDARQDVTFLGFGPDGKSYVAARAGEDLATLRTLDAAAGTVDKEVLVATPGYDFDGSLVASNKVLGVRLTTDATANIWFDPAMKSVQAAVDKALPGTVNVIEVPAKSGSPWMLVASYSDRQPLRYLLYHTGTGALEPIGTSYPNIDPARMGRQEPVRYKARDGLEIPGLLTLPPGGARKNLPMVVLVHGGPWERGSSWGWDPQSQFLASRGYAVLEVEFRGSNGFGARHFDAGLKQWGLAMQDDVADGTRWAIAQGLADPKRICIAGTEYGGYATLMGLARDPDLYRCGIEWGGVTDIELMYTGTWFSKPDASDAYLRYGMPALIGDPVKDAAQLQATSPIHQAARIRQPLLLAYGQVDGLVPLHHGIQFRDAVKRTNKQVEWVVYDGEGHGWSLEKNRIDFWKRVERFLDRQIGPSSAASVAASAGR
jgi:dipeptidyl aminopeptidase/acylaminoacyl peptidase